MKRVENQWIRSGWLICLILMMTMVWPARGKEPLTLPGALDMALQHNLALQQAHKQISLADAVVEKAQAAFLPSLSASVRGSERGSKVRGSDGRLSFDTGESISAGVSSSWTVFDGNNNSATLDQARFTQSASQRRFTRQEQDVMFEVISRFIQVLTDRELIQAEQENLVAQQQQLEKIKAFQSAGKRSVTDLYQQQADIADAEYGLLSAQRNFAVSRLLLMQTLGLELDEQAGENWALADVAIDRVLLQTGNEEINELQMAYENRMDLQSTKLDFEASGAEITAARSGKYPAVALSGDLGSGYSSGGMESGTFWDQFSDENPYVTLGVSISIPLFDRKTAQYNESRAVIQHEIDRLSIAQLEQKIGLEVQQAKQDLQTAQKKLQVSEVKLKYATQALAGYEERYSVNAATLAELSQSRAQHLDAVYAYVTAQYNVILANVNLAYTTGNTAGMTDIFTESSGN